MASEVFNESGNYVAKAKTATVVCVGSGGAGGDAGNGGGGGGAYASSAVSGLIIGHSYPIVVAADSDATFNTTTVVAKKGNTTASTAGGLGGTAAASTGDTKYNGGNGGIGLGGGGYGGGGGGSGGPSAHGSSGVDNSPGAGLGAGGPGSDVPSAGEPGEAPGGGGGGGGDPAPGGAGGMGRCTVTYTSVVSVASVIPEDPIPNETAITDRVLDPNEVLTDTPGIIAVAPAGTEYFMGFDLTLSQAGSACPLSIRDSNGTTILTIAGGLGVNQQIVMHSFPLRIAAGYALQLYGGGDNCILNGKVFFA